MNIHLGRKIKEVSESKNLKVKDLAEMTGKTTQSIYDIFRKEDLGTDVLKQFAEALEIPIVNFFIDNNSSHNSTTSLIQDFNANPINSKMTFNNGDCEKELDKALAIIQQMELRIKDKDETILILKERNK
jgi:transcriptional regulator with XRE-family HTH domain